jgi:hypothetical protein
MPKEPTHIERIVTLEARVDNLERFLTEGQDNYTDGIRFLKSTFLQEVIDVVRYSFWIDADVKVRLREND